MTKHPALPEVIFKRAVFAVGTPGAGKSHGVAESIVIPVLKRNQQVVIIDPTDAWFGLAVSKSGKRPSGYNITVFGGEHGSIPLTPNMGRAMGELLGKEPISAVLSIWHFSLEEQISFVSDFAAAIMEVNRKPIHLVIDEADEFIPQKPELGKELLKCKLRTKRIVTRGRKPGFRPVLITQRPQALDTAARNGCQVMMAFQCTGHHERTQIDDYIKSNGDPKVMADMLSSLVALRVGEAWVWAPRDKFLERIQFPKIDVYDSFDAIDEKDVPVKTVPVSDKRLKSIHAALEEFEEQRKANDPILLKRLVMQLESKLNAAERAAKSAPAQIPKAEKDKIAREAFDAGITAGQKQRERERQALIKLAEDLAGRIDELSDVSRVLEMLTGISNKIQKILFDIKNEAVLKKSSDYVPPSVAPAALPRPPVNSSRAPAPMDPFIDGTFTDPEKRILNSLGQWGVMGFFDPSRAQVAALAGWTPNTSTFTLALASLRATGYLDYGKGTIFLTPKGKHSVTVKPIHSLDDLHSRIKKTMTAPQIRVFDVLTPRGQEKVPRADLAGEAGWTPNTSTFTLALAGLRSRAVIEYGKGTVYLRPWVFMEQE